MRFYDHQNKKADTSVPQNNGGEYRIRTDDL